MKCDALKTNYSGYRILRVSCPVKWVPFFAAVDLTKQLEMTFSLEVTKIWNACFEGRKKTPNTTGLTCFF